MHRIAANLKSLIASKSTIVVCSIAAMRRIAGHRTLHKLRPVDGLIAEPRAAFEVSAVVEIVLGGRFGHL